MLSIAETINSVQFFSTAKLTKFYCGLAVKAGMPAVKKFENKAAALARITKAVQAINSKETTLPNDSDTITNGQEFLHEELTDDTGVAGNEAQAIEADPTADAEDAGVTAEAETALAEEPEINTRKKPGRKTNAEKEAAKAAKDAEKAAAKAAKPAKAAKAPKAEKTASDDDAATRGRLASCAGKKLFSLREANVRREGSHGWHSHNLYFNKPGMTYEEYREKGGRPQDLAWDLKHGHTKVE